METLLRHAHFSIQSRRLWKQFDSEVRRLLNIFLLVQQENNGKHDFTDKKQFYLSFRTKGVEAERKSWRGIGLDGSLAGKVDCDSQS